MTLTRHEMTVQFHREDMILDATRGEWRNNPQDPRFLKHKKREEILIAARLKVAPKSKEWEALSQDKKNKAMIKVLDQVQNNYHPMTNVKIQNVIKAAKGNSRVLVALKHQIMRSAPPEFSVAQAMKYGDDVIRAEQQRAQTAKLAEGMRQHVGAI